MVCALGVLAAPGRASADEPEASSSSPRARSARFSPQLGGEGAVAFVGSGGDFARSLRAGAAFRLVSAQAGFGVTALVTTFRSRQVPTDGEEWLVTFELGATAQLSLFDGHARSALGFGPSFLLRGAEVDELTNAPGMFLDLRPLGVRFPLGARTALVLDPLGVLIVAPRLSATPLADVQFNTTLSVEVLP